MKPILVVDWEADFIAALAGHLLQAHGPGLGRCVVVFPHRRPARHLVRALAELRPGPLLLPQMLSSQELVARLHAAMRFAPARQAGLLDRAGLLLRAVEALRGRGRGLLAEAWRDRLPERRRLFPWCARLAELLEECLRMGVRPADLRHLEGRVRPWAAVLLENLSAFFDAYLEGLEGAGLVTAGLMAWRVGREQERAVRSLGGQPVVLAGFHALAGVEEALFRTLWQEHDATLLWHTDPTLADPARRGAAHFCVAAHAEHLARWGARAEALPTPPRHERPSVRFVEGFDLHSQLGALRDRLAAEPDLSDSAVALPDSAALIPTLHHLPDRDINISMGYPLRRTALLELVETILRLQENGRGDGLYLWKDALALLRHPYLKALSPDAADSPPGSPAGGPGQPLRPAFHAMEAIIRQGPRHVDPLAIVPALEAEDLPEGLSLEGAEAFRREVLSCCLDGFCGLASLAELARALRRLCGLLQSHGAALWARFPLDAEALEHLIRRILPELESSLLSRETLPQGTIFAVFRHFLEQARVPFEAEPLTGLQVLGLLETRLLSFRRLCVLDATEDNLPGPAPADPLLPDPLRAMLGLPDGRQRDILAAYTFHRLVRACDDVTIYSQAGVQPGDILDGKATRSRFAEQLIWEEEKRLGRRLTAGDGPLQSVSLSVRPPLRPGRPAKKTPAAAARLDALLSAPVSPSLLDAFLRCPLRFYFERLLRLAPLAEVDDDGDPAEFGSAAHQALREFLAPWEGREVGRADLDGAALQERFRQLLDDTGYMRRLSYDRRLALDKTLPARMAAFAAAFPERTRILGLEQPARTELAAGGKMFVLEGRLDRVDERDGLRLVVDYKTGRIRPPRRAFFEDAGLWERIAGWTAEADPGLPGEVADAAGSLQMPAYLLLNRQAAAGRELSAAWVALGDDGAEVPFFPDWLDHDGRRQFVEHRARALVTFGLRCLTESPAFAPRPERHCAWCPYAGACDAPKPRG